MTSQATTALPALQLQWGKTTPVILQAEAAECALACLAMICGYHGKQIDMYGMRQRFPNLCQQGLTLRQMLDVGQQLDFHCRPLKLDMSHLKKLRLPCVLHWDMQHFVVLIKVRKNHIIIHDPALGKRHVSIQETADHFTGVGVEFTPSQEFKQQINVTSIGFSHLWQQLIGLKRSLTLLFILTFLLQLFSVASPYYMQLVIDEVVVREDSQLLQVLALGFVGLLLVETMTSFVRKTVILQLSSHLSQRLSVNVFSHILTLPFAFFNRRHLGDIVSRFSSLNHIREFLTTGFVTVVMDGLLAIITLSVMFIYHPTLAWIALAVCVFYIALRLVLLAPLRRLQQEKLQASAKESTHFMESIRSIQSVKLLGIENLRQTQWQNLLTRSINKDIRIAQWELGFFTGHYLLFGLENILIVYLAAGSVIENTMTIGMLYAFMSYKNRFSTSIDSLTSKIIEWKMLTVHFERLSDLVLEAGEKSPSITTWMASPQGQDTTGASIEVKDLQVCFQPKSPVFSQVNMSIAAGELIVITGQSGCGKSTFIKCLMGLLPPDEGVLTINNHPLTTQARPPCKIAAVMQDDKTLSGNIIDNISGFSAKVDLPWVMECSQIACLHHVITSLPMQYYTQLGDLGNAFSGGQLQRLFLARALYQRPDILIMDEGSSHLDVECEARINKNLSQLSMTRILIAHRPQTILLANRRYHFQHGTLTEVPVNYQLNHSATLPNKGESYVSRNQPI
jgi:ATP-binding cassette subfamily B protein RaxB